MAWRPNYTTTLRLLEDLRPRRIVYSGADEDRLAEVRGMDAVVAKPDGEALLEVLERLVPVSAG